MIWQRWDELSDRLAIALESPDPDAYIASLGDPELAEFFAWHKRAGDFLQSRRPAPDNPWIGRLIQGRYRLESVLGRGGSGVVFRARDERVAGRRVVIKLLHDFWASEDWMRERFRGEAAVLARLDHPGIVSLIDAAEAEDGRLFLVFPFHEGRSLREALTAGPLDAPFAARLFREVGDAIGYSHTQGVLHRDLKPENILLVRRSDGEHPLVIDFGIAQTGHPAVSAHITTHLMGSAAYMAPEHLMGKPVAASDVYSLGVIAWEILSGSRPFECESPFGLTDLQRRGPGESFYRLRPDLGTTVGKLLERAVAFDPGKRPAHVTAFTAALADALKAGPSDSPLARMWAVRRSRRWIVAGAAASVAAGAGGWWRLESRAALPPIERVIDFPAGYTGEMAGFSIHRELTERAIRQLGNGAVVAIRCLSPDQGQLHRPLRLRQKEEAFRRGWKASVLLRPESGYAALGLTCGQFAPRFDAGFKITARGVDLIATKQIRKGWDGIHAAVNLPREPEFVRLELAYDAARKSATVSVDGRALIRDYAGHLEYRDDLGVYLGVGSIDGSIGSTVFGGLHFEILG